MKTKTMSFRFSGKMARLLGRESVSSDVAALFELVKNGYDADATHVKVTFENLKVDGGKNARITVEDNGEGMSMDDFEDKWMVIGTDVKERDHFTKRRKRRVIGNKGVGRFSTEKLCKRLTLISKPWNNRETIQVKINWDDYEKENVTFNDVFNPVEISQRENISDAGVKIILEDLRESWTAEKIDRLRTAIGSLILPEELAKVVNDKFEVSVFSNEFKSQISPGIQSTLFKVAPFKIISSIGMDKPIFKVSILREGKIVREDHCDLSKTVMANGDEWKPFGTCKVTIYFFPFKTRYEDWDKYYKKALKTHNIHTVLSEIHGIKLYRDNFWVRPYGEKGDDWLSLEMERVMANYKVGSTQVIGFVEISKDENLEIIDTTTRERLVENSAFHCMRTYVKEVIDQMNNYRYEQNKKMREKLTQVHHENVIDSEVNHLKEMIDENDVLSYYDKKELKKSLSQITRVFSDYKEETDESVEKLEISERAYRNLASLGISSATTAHEIAHVVGNLHLFPKAIFGKLKTKKEARDLIEEDLHNATSKINTIRHFTTFVIQFVQTLAYDNEIKHEKEKFEVGKSLNEFLEDFTGILNMSNINLKIKSIPEKIPVYMNKADFESIILNLFSNSIKALKRMPQKAERKIRVTVTQDKKKFKIKFSDNGPGIAERNKDKVFRLFFTTNKKGTGLGLPIVKEILEEYDGTAELITSELDDGATFLITIPVEALHK